ncbi:hypothetical protein PanWU01x14_209020 [Parasponia andersonii]|uniref:Uncharacterized protein n=1 Tax=Parasponia andersonii TaxID=3476 RepID=A0A2P5BUN3_PARAD|nr:hypothetical protein PanWU01x14_209020 [Parasponia andersonii]
MSSAASYAGLALTSVALSPPGLRHDHRNVLVPGDHHRADDDVNHHVEEISIPNFGDDILLEPKIGALDQGRCTRPEPRRGSGSCCTDRC